MALTFWKENAWGTGIQDAWNALGWVRIMPMPIAA